MRRTQIYLEDNLRELLDVRARIERTTISDLLRTAAWEKYGGGREQRVADMQAIIGLWKDRDDLGDSEEYIRKLRRSGRRKKMLESISE